MSKKIDIAAIRAEFQRLLQTHGNLTPEMVVDAARDLTHPAHDHFEWDDTQAAQEYRVIQARRLMSVTRVSMRIGEDQVFLPAYVRNPDLPSTQAGYVETLSLRNDRERALEVLVQEFTRVDAGMHRMFTLARVFGMEPEVNAMMAAASQARERLVALQA